MNQDYTQEKLSKADKFKRMYDMVSSNTNSKLPVSDDEFKDWKLYETKHDKKSNFKAAVYINEKTKEVAVFNLGTDFKNPKDIMANLKMGINKPTRQMDMAYEYHKQLADRFEPQGYKMNSIGHSEGGSESQYVGLEHPTTDVYTYNAYGIGRMKPAKDISHNAQNIYNFRDPQDPVSKLGKSVGTDFIVPISSETRRKPYVFGYKEAHQIKNMGDIKNAILADEYKKMNSNLSFIDNMDNVLFTNEDIGAMDRFTFETYEPLINKRLEERSIMPRSEANLRAINGGNVIYVNGYTRSNGVEVSGYYRSVS